MSNTLPSVAIGISLPQGSAPNGSIVCTEANSTPVQPVYKLCDTPNSTNFYGVVIQEPVLRLSDETISDPVSVAREGQVAIRVNAGNGPIATGDGLATSAIAGVAQKANEGDPTLAVAIEAFEGSSTGQSGIIIATLGVSPLTDNPMATTSTTPVQLTNQQLEPPTTPLAKIAMAAALLGLAIFGAIYIVRRASQASIEAIGRNPLATSPIQASMWASYVLVATMIGAALVASYVLINL